MSKPLSIGTDGAVGGVRGDYVGDLRWLHQCACLVTLLLMLCMSGCVTNATLPDPAGESSVIAYTNNLRQITSTLLDKVVVALPNAGVDHSDYTAWSGEWCPRHESVHSVQDVQREISRYCKNVGGLYSDAICQSARDASEVMFYAAVGPEGNCQQVANPVGVRIIEPKPGKTRSPEYLAALHQVGYRTHGEIVAADAAHQREAQEERDRIVRELPLVRTRGTRVCKKEPEITFVGFVEDVSGPKIRISIQKAYYTNLLGVQGLASKAENYEPQTILDLPENWRVCE